MDSMLELRTMNYELNNEWSLINAEIWVIFHFDSYFSFVVIDDKNPFVNESLHLFWKCSIALLLRDTKRTSSNWSDQFSSRCARQMFSLSNARTDLTERIVTTLDDMLSHVVSFVLYFAWLWCDFSFNSIHALSLFVPLSIAKTEPESTESAFCEMFYRRCVFVSSMHCSAVFDVEQENCIKLVWIVRSAARRKEV